MISKILFHGSPPPLFEAESSWREGCHTLKEARGRGKNGPGSWCLFKDTFFIRPHFLKGPAPSNCTTSRGLLTHELCRSSLGFLPVEQGKCLWMASCWAPCTLRLLMVITIWQDKCCTLECHISYSTQESHRSFRMNIFLNSLAKCRWY